MSDSDNRHLEDTLAALSIDPTSPRIMSLMPEMIALLIETEHRFAHGKLPGRVTADTIRDAIRDASPDVDALSIILSDDNYYISRLRLLTQQLQTRNNEQR